MQYLQFVPQKPCVSGENLLCFNANWKQKSYPHWEDSKLKQQLVIRAFHTDKQACWWKELRREMMVWWGNQENTKSGNMRKTTMVIGLFVLQFTLTFQKISSEDPNCSPNVCVCRKGNSCSLEWRIVNVKEKMHWAWCVCNKEINAFVQFHGWKDQDKHQ